MVSSKGSKIEIKEQRQQGKTENIHESAGEKGRRDYIKHKKNGETRKRYRKEKIGIRRTKNQAEVAEQQKVYMKYPGQRLEGCCREK